MKRVALLPNLFTTGNMVCGICAILYALSAVQTGNVDDFKKACALLMLAILLDGLDGKIAVWTRSCTEFGVQYDSMSDLISFGVAPAFLMTSHLVLEAGGGKPSPVCWAMSLILIVCAALRLARFNLQSYGDEKASFEGLPSPVPAGFISLLLLSSYRYGIPLHPITLLLVSVTLGGLMISRVPYPSLKKSDFLRTQPLESFFLVVLFLGLVIMEPVGPLLAAAGGYILFGIVRKFSPAPVKEFFARLLEDSEDATPPTLT